MRARGQNKKPPGLLGDKFLRGFEIKQSKPFSQPVHAVHFEPPKGAVKKFKPRGKRRQKVTLVQNR